MAGRRSRVPWYPHGRNGHRSQRCPPITWSGQPRQRRHRSFVDVVFPGFWSIDTIHNIPYILKYQTFPTHGYRHSLHKNTDFPDRQIELFLLALVLYLVVFYSPAYNCVDSSQLVCAIVIAILSIVVLPSTARADMSTGDLRQAPYHPNGGFLKCR